MHDGGMSASSPISDPARIRALAHPVRLELLDFLGDVEDATATQCAEHIGESVASCSFHLRTLHKHGFIERAESRGREKPWRVVKGGYDLRPRPEQPGSAVAISEVASLHLTRESERIRGFLSQFQHEEHEWTEATTLASGSFWATAEEAARFCEDLRNLSERFAGRSEDPTLRPEGARLMRTFNVVNPEPETN